MKTTILVRTLYGSDIVVFLYNGNNQRATEGGSNATRI